MERTSAPNECTIYTVCMTCQRKRKENDFSYRRKKELKSTEQKINNMHAYAEGGVQCVPMVLDKTAG